MEFGNVIEASLRLILVCGRFLYSKFGFSINEIRYCKILSKLEFRFKGIERWF